MLKLKVKFIKRLYGTNDSDYSVFSAETVDADGDKLIKVNKYGNFTINGNFNIDEDELGDVFTVTIEEDVAAKYPNSYKFLKIHYEFPTEAKGQWDFLKTSNVMPLITFLAVENAFNKSDKILDIIMKNPLELTKAKGVGESRAKYYQEKIIKNADRAAIFAEYGDIEGVGPSIIKTLVEWKARVTDTIKAINKDPFSLLENPNIGFVIADRFRAHCGLPLNDENRILHGVMYYLEERFQNSGDTYEDIYIAARYASSKLLVSYEEIILLLSKIKDDEKALSKYKIKIFGKNVTINSLFVSELLIYNKTRQMMKDKKVMVPTDIWAKNKKEYLSKLDSTLSKTQESFLDIINEERITVLLGPGGSGKSWITNIACQLIKKAGLTYGLFAPTARAAHVMSEYTNDNSSTIHRGLMGIANMNEVAPYDVLIIDEYSMVDSELAAIVLKTIGNNTRLIIIGDDFQLQSVGPGNVLFDLVNFIEVPTVKFVDIYRQKEDSGVLDYTNALREGVFNLPDESSRVDNGDIVFINEFNEKKQRDIAMKLYENALETNKIAEIMLLSPVNKGLSGRVNLNKEVQNLVNPYNNSNDMVFGADSDNKKSFKANDYITVKKNMYDIVDDNKKDNQLINGDLGEIISTTEKLLTFDIDGSPYTIDKSEVNDLIDHAWATTIHKAQGGQANIVIIVLPPNSCFMLNSNMLYTALTRTKVKCYVIGSFKDMNNSAKTQANFTRKTMIQLQSLTNDQQIKAGKEIKKVSDVSSTNTLPVKKS